MTRKKKAPVRTVKKSAVPAKETSAAKAEKPVEQEGPIPDNVVPLQIEAPEVIEDPVNVYKMLMLENELAKIQLQMQVAANKAGEQISNAIAQRDKTLAALQGLFDKKQKRLIKLKDYVEDKYGIGLKQYVYEDEIGVFKKVKSLEKKKESGGKEGE